jgi:hypothetical protein
MRNLFSNHEPIDKLEDLIGYSWQKALKYRFDPVIGRIYDEYLEALKHIKQKELEKDESSSSNNERKN